MASKNQRSARSYDVGQYAAFRKRLLEARESLGLTQRDAAAALRRSQSFVAKCESGERRVDVVELAKFAELYKRKLEFFLS